MQECETIGDVNSFAPLVTSIKRVGISVYNLLPWQSSVCRYVHYCSRINQDCFDLFAVEHYLT